jgi:vitamin B12 transporter
MKIPHLAGLAAVVALGAHAQQPYSSAAPTLAFQSLDSMIVTATRSPQRASDALRDVTVITREEIDRAGAVSLAEILQREALVEYRGTGGPGQPAGLFLRGANAGQTLVLVDGLRVSSATVGTASIENIPLDLIERIEVVKGPLSSLYGPDAIGGVVQIFTRASAKPRLFGSASYGSDSDRSISAGFTAIENDTTVSFSAGGRKVDAASATNERAFCHDPDRDPYQNAFANAKVVTNAWNGETVTLSGWVSEGKAHFDGCPDSAGRYANDLNKQSLSGAQLSSFRYFEQWWLSRFTIGEGRDKLSIEGNTPARFETRQAQASWVNEFGTQVGTVTAGLETVRQEVLSDTVFTQTRRDTNSGWLSIRESWGGQGLEASLRRDEDDQFGARNTGSVSYGAPWPGVGMITTTAGRGFRAPTFFDLYAPSSDFYVPNPDLRPEQSRSVEMGLRSEAGSAWIWRLVWFDNRIEDLITYTYPTMANVNRARIHGLEGSAEVTLWGVRMKASAVGQRPRDEDTGYMLQGRAQYFGRIEAMKAFGEWSLSGGASASSERFDSTNESPQSRLPGYAIADAALRYAPGGGWNISLSAANLFDKRYEQSVGYDAPRRSILFSVRFEGF